jgi:hypothetical protein
MRPESPAYQTAQERSAILASLPLVIVGLFLVMFALVNAKWPPDYLDAPYGQAVSHWQRLTGDDAPAPPGGQPLEVTRPTGYELRRFLDALVYFAVLVGLGSVIGLAWLGERLFYLPLMVVGLYGLCYAAGIGLSIGPMLAAAGFAPVFLGAMLGWIITESMADHPNDQQQRVTGIRFTG